VEVTVTDEDLRELFSQYGKLDPVEGVILFRRDIPGNFIYSKFHIVVN
jgi:RNA recognition motif-containing protein